MGLCLHATRGDLLLLFWGGYPRIDANGVPRSKQYNKRDFYPSHFKNESLQPRNWKTLDNINLNQMSHRYVSSDLQND